MPTRTCNSDRMAVFLLNVSLLFGLGIVVLPAASQDAAPTAPPADAQAPAVPKKVELPEGEGKPIATEYCQDCHRLTNMTRAHKSADDWRDTVQLMIDRGARLPQENVDVLVQYLATNFGPKTNASAPAAPADAPASPAATPTPAAADTPATPATPGAATPAAAKPVVLPDGDGKEIATENCQLCHQLTNLTKAHKSLEDWRDTVQLMMDRGATVPADQVETLVQYLAKNFGSKLVDSTAGAAPASANPVTSESH